MIQTYTWWEIALAAALFLLAALEVIQLAIARSKGLTENISRLVTHLVLMLLLVAYAAYTLFWSETLEKSDLAALVRESPTLNWTYLLLGVMVAVIVSYELIALARARGRGLTSNLSRVVSHAAMLILLVVLMGISMLKWDLYLDKLATAYKDSLRQEEIRP